MIRLATVSVGGVRWHLTPAASSVISPDDLRLSEHVKSGRAVVVKHGEHRTVYRVPLAGGHVYWKHCRLNGPRAWFRDLFRGPKARLEFDRLRELSARGIATIEPLAWGRIEAPSPRGSFLITRALDDAIPLDDYLINHPPRTPSIRRSLTLALGRYVAALHAAGVCHPDFHPGNLLIREDGGSSRFYLIDVHDVQLGPPLSLQARRGNLILLSRWFRLRVERTDRMRFWLAYAGANAPRYEARELERLSARSILDLMQSRDRRCLRENRHFRRVRGPAAAGFAVRELDQALASTLTRDPDGPFRDAASKLLKDSRSSTVCALEVPSPTGPRAMIYKRFKVTRWFDPLINCIRPSPALRSWSSGHAFLDRALPTPRPWLMLHRRRFGLPTVGYLLCDQVVGAEHLNDFVATIDRHGLLQITERLAQWVRRMHERGVTHRDLKAPNILFDRGGECRFIDLAGVRTRRHVTERARIRDLMRLNASFVASMTVTRSMRLRFLRTYLQWGTHGKEGWKRWWVAVDRATQEKVRRNARRQRPLY
jgi:tRNA A-37 threonylcarbamoyl transferase component Bud32